MVIPMKSGDEVVTSLLATLHSNWARWSLSLLVKCVHRLRRSSTSICALRPFPARDRTPGPGPTGLSATISSAAPFMTVDYHARRLTVTTPTALGQSLVEDDFLI